jgi:hypothetical protein
MSFTHKSNEAPESFPSGARDLATRTFLDGNHLT